MVLRTDPANGETPDRFDHQLLASYYDEFRQIARRTLNRSDDRITIQPTDLAHEAAMRLLKSNNIAISDETHFLALGARVIRATLIDEVRRRRAAKRDVAMVTRWNDALDGGADGGEDRGDLVDLEAFDGLIGDLEVIDADAAAVVHLRFYVGLTMTEIARELAVSESTALRRWRVARAWLLKELSAAS